MSGRSLLSQRLQESDRQLREEAGQGESCTGSCSAPCGAPFGSLKRCESEAFDEALDEIRCILKGSAPLGPACFACSPPLRDFGNPLTHPVGRCTPKQKKSVPAAHVGPHTSA